MHIFHIFIAISIVFVAKASAADGEQSLLLRGLNRIISLVQTQMEHGFPKLSIPPLVPLVILNQNIFIGSNRVLGANFHISQLNISNLQHFHIRKIEPIPVRKAIELHLVFPEINVTAFHDASTSFFGRNFTVSNGTSNFLLKTLEFRGLANMSTVNMRPNISDVVIRLDLEKIESAFPNSSQNILMDRISSDALNHFGSVIIQSAQEAVQAVVANVLVPEINGIFQKTTIKNIYKYIKNAYL